MIQQKLIDTQTLTDRRQKRLTGIQYCYRRFIFAVCAYYATIKKFIHQIHEKGSRKKIEELLNTYNLPLNINLRHKKIVRDINNWIKDIGFIYKTLIKRTDD